MGLLKRLVEFTLWLMPIFENPNQKPLNLFPNKGKPLTPAQAPIQTQPCSKFNSINHRECWSPGYDIKTDYELPSGIPPGKLVEYDFTLSNELIDPDGYMADGMVINGQYPGPTIRANWGDTIRITVRNHLVNNNGTAIHWHGLRQFETNWQDGVPGVTQCPIKPGSVMVYELLATQYGTSWYHSHFSLQYSDGLLGAIHIHGPTSMNYDEDIGPLLISDWYHHDTFSLFHQEIAAGPPQPDSIIMNGVGIYDCKLSDPKCTGTRRHHEIDFVAGRTYKLSLVNTAAATQFRFWIDGHNFTVVQTDFVPIQPYDASIINLAIGQRIVIVVAANANTKKTLSDFWIHARNCGNPAQNSTLGIIRYNKRSRSDPPTPTPNAAQSLPNCDEEPLSSMIPIVPRTVGERINSMEPSDWLKVGRQGFPNTTDPSSRFNKWIIGNSSLYLNWADPSLELIAVDNTLQFPAATAPIFLDFTTGEWVYFLIVNNFTNEPDRHPLGAAAHPIHLHGHDFVILDQQANAVFDPVTARPNLSNPPRRDVAMLPANGYLWIAFKIDNPGAWVMHCHIAWHASAGLALQFVEQPGKIKLLMEAAGVLPDFEKRCDEWTDYYTEVNVPDDDVQEDSGI